ncbi:MAG: phospho-N-acetylmuramoyl-pentapeptide-transferase [Clostridia bacterium]|nr:phospho-N-acetylmuramoyl-pentapeptide-transferase [Clostridia bacterium]
MRNVIPIFLMTFFITLLLGFILIPLLKKFKAKQTILCYVKEHSAKQGIPTMGGVIFLTAITICYFVYGLEVNKIALLALVITLAYGVVGFLDDFIKIRYKQNKGLNFYQKLTFQLMVALIAAFFVYENNITVLDIPFLNTQIDLGKWIIPFSMLVFLATCNGVNLTDGLDGLSGGTSLICLTALSVMIYFKYKTFDMSGNTFLAQEHLNLLYLSVSGAGAMMGYLCFNRYPAKIIMGDTGALALGGLIASLAIFSGYSLFIPLLGIMFVVSAVSVIVQVLSFQIFNKRVILMAPFHHHLQQKGYHEVVITTAYITVTLIISMIMLYFTFA